MSRSPTYDLRYGYRWRTLRAEDKDWFVENFTRAYTDCFNLSGRIQEQVKMMSEGAFDDALRRSADPTHPSTSFVIESTDGRACGVIRADTLASRRSSTPGSGQDSGDRVTMMLSNVLVDPSHRSRSDLGLGLDYEHRLGPKLLARCLSHARGASASAMQLTSYPQFERASKLYEKFGFEKTGSWQEQIGDVAVMDEVWRYDVGGG